MYKVEWPSSQADFTGSGQERGDAAPAFPRASPGHPRLTSPHPFQAAGMKKPMDTLSPNVHRADQEESKEERIARIRTRVKAGFYARSDVMRDVADALLYDPSAFENLP